LFNRDIILRAKYRSLLEKETKMARKRFHVPDDLQPLWHTLASRYHPYLPEIQMDENSFVARPEEAADLFRELEEMKSRMDHAINHGRLSKATKA
jgi:hypothetical protein